MVHVLQFAGFNCSHTLLNNDPTCHLGTGILDDAIYHVREILRRCAGSSLSNENWAWWKQDCMRFLFERQLSLLQISVKAKYVSLNAGEAFLE